VAIVTGAASGIGLATARRLLAAGARVVAADLDAAGARAALGAVGDDAWCRRCDVSDERDVADPVAGAVARYGRLDVVVNNAGRMVFKPIEQHTLRDWMDVLSVDLLGAFFFIRAAFQVMRPGGAIVNVSSVHAVETTPLVAAYAAAKAALVSLTHTAAIEGKDRGLRVNAVLPGAIDTPMLWNNPNVRSGLEVIHKTDVGTPEDVARAIAFLASPDARFIRGASLNVDGGRLTRL
jgi:NAD(P)-dependent dehydrogenase (short-subunit alcohol dehydrogenase family)